MSYYLEKIQRLQYINAKPITGSFPWFTHGTDELHYTHDAVTGGVELAMNGTARTAEEWAYNFRMIRDPWVDMGCVHGGFALNVQRIMGGQDNPRSVVSRCIDSTGMITCIGHSRAGPGVKLAASYLVKHGVDPERIRVVVFGSPRVGNSDFTRAYNAMLGHRTTTINLKSDIIAMVPPWEKRVGQEIIIDDSPYLIPRHSLVDYAKYLKTAGV